MKLWSSMPFLAIESKKLKTALELIPWRSGLQRGKEMFGKASISLYLLIDDSSLPNFSLYLLEQQRQYYEN